MEDSKTQLAYSEEQLGAMRWAWMDQNGAMIGVEMPKDACGLSLLHLPAGAKVSGFADLARDLSADPRGFALLTGVEDGPAGLGLFRGIASVVDDHVVDEGVPARAFSFCVDGATYTAFEDPSENGPGQMGSLVRREGNWCARSFAPCALAPCVAAEVLGSCGSKLLRQMIPLADVKKGGAIFPMALLLIPGGSEVALAVGTAGGVGGNGWFQAYVDDAVLARAMELGIALAHELDDLVPRMGPVEGPKSAIRL